uniref:Flap endonuclease 1 n=2 Tax=environmental samples TaxID=651140 RepID=A0A075FX27_9ARCH|nr:flap endonuclease-1 (FEN1, RAD2) [uncultured marine thaumarchaeote AD1000_71_A04]AIF10871.1 flap endonuclease-1 (FEN1, RAD2) [uncultured marine thaumarchaeote KM3_47_C08]|tara:strand:- start:806 stop:1831 length:1026 start_codon:yes stop_codon:yes gene_type:complete
MGVKLKDLANPRKTSFENLSGNSIAIDGYNIIYQFLTTIRGPTGEPLMNSKGKITSHITGLFYRNINLLNNNIRPIYVLDGKPPQLKSTLIKKRKEIREKNQEKYQKAKEEGDLEQARRYAHSMIKINEGIINDVKKILDLMGIQCIQAPAEGEATVAYMNELDLVNYAVSQDYDSLLFGAKRLCRNLTVSGKRRIPRTNRYMNVEPEIIELKEFLRINEINREQLVDIAILIGTDYNPNGFTRIGPKTAIKNIKKYKRIEEIPKIERELELIDVDQVRNMFLNPDVIKPEIIENKELKKEELISYLCDENDFSEERISNTIKKLDKVEEQQSETLDKWFN